MRKRKIKHVEKIIKFNFNHPSLKYIKNHTCYVEDFFIFDVNYDLIQQKSLLYIEDNKYQLNKTLYKIIKKQLHIRYDSYVLILPQKLHNRACCLMYSTFSNFIFTNVKYGLLSDNYLILFNPYVVSFKIDQSQIEVFHDFIQSKLLIKKLAYTD